RRCLRLPEIPTPWTQGVRNGVDIESCRLSRPQTHRIAQIVQLGADRKEVERRQHDRIGTHADRPEILADRPSRWAVRWHTGAQLPESRRPPKAIQIRQVRSVVLPVADA